MKGRPIKIRVAVNVREHERRGKGVVFIVATETRVGTAPRVSAVGEFFSEDLMNVRFTAFVRPQKQREQDGEYDGQAGCVEATAPYLGHARTDFKNLLHLQETR